MYLVSIIFFQILHLLKYLCFHRETNGLSKFMKKKSICHDLTGTNQKIKRRCELANLKWKKNIKTVFLKKINRQFHMNFC